MSKSLKNLTLILGALGVAALLAASACENQGTTTTPNPTNIPTITPTPTVQPGEDDDRPPVIISGGSVHLHVVAKNKGAGTNNDAGEWKFDSGNKLWYHDHQYLQPAKHLLVHVLHGKDSPACESYKTEYDVRELTVNYGIGGHFRVFIDASGNGAGRLATDADGKPDKDVPFWFDIGIVTDRPTSVVLGDAKTGTKCGLDIGKAEVHIYQRIN